jgi:hypothetical protein
MSSRRFAHSVLIFNRLEVSICPDCGLLVAGSRDQRLLKIAEHAHGRQHRKSPAKVAPRPRAATA